MTDINLTPKCCIVGAGPAGVIAAYLLAQRGVDVLLLEAHRDFDRDFRGDTIHAGIMEVLDEMGLAEELLQLPHPKMQTLGLTANGVTQQIVDFRDTGSRFPWVTMMPQSQFLEFMVDRARAFDTFHIRMGARVTGVTKTDRGHGIEFKKDGVVHNVTSELVIAADGRHSTIRKLMKLQPKQTSVPMDVLWFRIPRNGDDGISPGGYVGGGHLLIVLERTDEWQIGFAFLHGTFRDIKAKGLDGIKAEVSAILPAVRAGMTGITEWKDVAVLNVESSRLAKWYDRNLLLIGDAAHVMSPVGGVGINYAIQDAIVTASIVGPALQQSSLSEAHLARVQKKRIWPTRVVQWFQGVLQKRIVRAALNNNSEFTPPWLLRFAFVRKRMARFIAFGLFTVELPKPNRQD